MYCFLLLFYNILLHVLIYRLFNILLTIFQHLTEYFLNLTFFFTYEGLEKLNHLLFFFSL